MLKGLREAGCRITTISKCKGYSIGVGTVRGVNLALWRSNWPQEKNEAPRSSKLAPALAKHSSATGNYSRKSIIRTSIIRTVNYMNTQISIVARANTQKYITTPLNL